MMRGVTSTQLSLILDFMYYGEVAIPSEELNIFMNTGRQGNGAQPSSVFTFKSLQPNSLKFVV